MDSLCTYAWRLHGNTGSESGFLVLAGKQIQFRSYTAPMQANLSEVENIRYPWYYFGGGFKCKIRGEEFRFSLVLPNANTYPDESLVSGLKIMTKGRKHGMGYRLAGPFCAIIDARKAMHEWRKVFSSR